MAVNVDDGEPVPAWDRQVAATTVSKLSASRQDRADKSGEEMKPNGVKSRFLSHGGLTSF
ncbi:hypothetical protein [Devosia sp. A16]|uniref:hypothetical protein n=1 Tax=Devosia sp. A16 TaxID=1736675 RepID=UPI0012E25318|nr:hypothetical protein [Devosia sp. A16]